VSPHHELLQCKTRKPFPELARLVIIANWSFLSNHGRVLLCIAGDPAIRLRDIAAQLGITERRAYGIVADLTQAGCVAKLKDGRRNRYQIQVHLPLPEPASQQPTIGELLALLAGASPSASPPLGPQDAASSAVPLVTAPLSTPVDSI
jgi:hypothetical protein